MRLMKASNKKKLQNSIGSIIHNLCDRTENIMELIKIFERIIQTRIRILLGTGDESDKNYISFDSLNMECNKIRITKNPHCDVCNKQKKVSL